MKKEKEILSHSQVMAERNQAERNNDLINELELDTHFLNLGYLPSLIQTYIDCYKLDKTEPTPAELDEFTCSRNTLYKLLSLIQNELYEVNDTLNKYI